MSISEQAAQEVKEALEHFLNEKLQEAHNIENLYDRGAAATQVKNDYYKHFSLTCDALGIKLKTWDQLG